MAHSEKLQYAFQLFDAANKEDPNKEIYKGETFSKELLYAQRMTERLNIFAPTASEALQLTARCQHICRWEIARNSYPMDRTGYLRWRQDLKKFHAKKAQELLETAGYDDAIISKVKFLLEKKQLKKNEETQLLEDVICLVFLEHYFEPFAAKHPEDKTIDILQKTWKKMSPAGHEAALKLPLSKNSVTIISKALDA